jgi:hypothetical protein
MEEQFENIKSRLEDYSEEDSTFRKIISILRPSYASTIFYGSIVLMLIALYLDLPEHTFISFWYIVVIFVFGAILSGLIHFRFVRDKNGLLRLVFGYGLISVFLFFFLNFYFPQSEAKVEILGITKKGEYPTNNRAQWVEFTRKNTTEKIRFLPSEGEKAKKSNLVKIETATGLFGFEIIMGKELMNDEKLTPADN